MFFERQLAGAGVGGKDRASGFRAIDGIQSFIGEQRTTTFHVAGLVLHDEAKNLDLKELRSHLEIYHSA